MQSIEMRLIIWKHAWEAFLSSPINGIGWGEFPYYLYENLTTIGMDRNAHNLFLHFLAETGLVGFLLLGYALYQLFPRKMQIENKWLYGILGIQAIHSMLEFPLFYLHFLIPTAIIIGLVNANEK